MCDKSWYVSGSKSIYQLGYLVASLVFGYGSDRFGRRTAYLAAIGVELVSSLSQALAINIYQFMLARFCLGLGAYGRFTCGALLRKLTSCDLQQNSLISRTVFEWAGPKRRAQVIPILEYGWVAGQFLLPISFSVIRHFRHMQLIVFFYELAFVYWIWQTPESPSWLIIKGRYEEAIKVLTAAIEMNKLGTKADVERKFLILKSKILADEKEREAESKKTLWDVWKSPILLRYCLTFYVISFCVFFIMYGSGYNARYIYGSLYETAIIGQVFSIGKYFLMFSIVNHIDRKPLALIMSFAGSSLLLVMIPFMLAAYSIWYQASIGMVGRFMQGMAFSTVGIFRTEIFPTGVRQLADGSCSMVGRIGSVIAPFVKELGEATHMSVPVAIFAAMGFIIGIMIFTLPETRNQPLPETIREAESRK